jgi:hypothetical protein
MATYTASLSFLVDQMIVHRLAYDTRTNVAPASASLHCTLNSRRLHQNQKREVSYRPICRPKDTRFPPMTSGSVPSQIRWFRSMSPSACPASTTIKSPSKPKDTCSPTHRTLSLCPALSRDPSQAFDLSAMWRSRNRHLSLYISVCCSR